MSGTTIIEMQMNKLRYLKAQISNFEKRDDLFSLEEIRQQTEPLRNQLRKLERTLDTNKAKGIEVYHSKKL